MKQIKYPYTVTIQLTGVYTIECDDDISPADMDIEADIRNPVSDIDFEDILINDFNLDATADAKITKISIDRSAEKR